MTDACAQLHPEKRQRSRQTNRPLCAIDKSTARGRRVRDLTARLLTGISVDDPAAIEACIALAELTVAAEEARRANNVDINQLVRLESLVDRRKRRLAAEHGKPEPTPAPMPDNRPSLAALLRRKSGAAP